MLWSLIILEVWLIYPPTRNLLGVGGYTRLNTSLLVMLRDLKFNWLLRVIVDKRAWTGETFSLVAKMVIVRAIVALAASKGWFIQQMNVHNAFLNDDMVEEVYMSIPSGFASQWENGEVCKLHK